MKIKTMIAGMLLLGALTVRADDNEQWISLFNGKNLDGWTPKLAGHELGDNWGDTFRVTNGVMQVSYDKYQNFGDKFGHIFYKQPFSHYRIRAEYRFTGNQCPGGPGWAFRNSGIMIHCQDPKTIRKEQNFPVSIEVQLLGGSDKGERSTGNMCSPGTHIVLNGQLCKQHCINSRSKTFNGDQWVTIEIEVHGNKLVIHKINGEPVLEYEKPQLDENDADAKKLIKDGDVMLSSGYISLQAESHPVEFRKIELLPLAP
jgi:hypothetical protein